MLLNRAIYAQLCSRLFGYHCAQKYAGIIHQGLMDSQSHVHYLFLLLVLVHLTLHENGSLFLAEVNFQSRHPLQ